MGQSKSSHYRETNRKSIRTSLLLLFLFISVTCLGLGACSMISNKSESLWILVDGFILSSDIETHVIVGENKDQTTSIFYRAVAQFQYIVEDHTYTNTHQLGYVRKNDPSEARVLMNDYPMGKVVRIAYNPEEPSESRIVTASSGTPYAFLLTGMLFLLGSVLVLRLTKVSSSNGYTASRSAVKCSHPVEKNQHNQSRQAPSSPNPQSELSGIWKLDYQIPSMREIIAFSQKGKNVDKYDRHAVLSTGAESLTVTISDHDIEFTFKDKNNQGSCVRKLVRIL